MYPTISHLTQDLFGFSIPLPIQSFGFFVAIAFVLATYFSTKELKRKEQQGLLKATKKLIKIGEAPKIADFIFPFVITTIIAAKLVFIIFNYQLFQTNAQEVILSTKGNWVMGLIIAFIYTYFVFKNKQKETLQRPQTKEILIYPHQHMSNIVFIAAIAGILGAKIFHNLENIDEFLANPIDALFSFSGLTFYGGLIVATIAIWYYAKRNNIAMIHLADATAPALMLAYGVGRIGCQVSGDGDWGIVNLSEMPAIISFLPEWFWKYNYPHNVINAGVPIPGCVGNYCSVLPEPVFPTPLYESIAGISLFFVLMALRTKIQIPGMMFSIYLLFNGLERFLIEKIRVNSLYHIGNLEITQAEIISFAIIIMGIYGIFYFKKKALKQTA